MENLIDKIGLDRVAHFGIGGALFAAFNLMFGLSLIDAQAISITWWTVLVLPLAGYIIVAIAEFAKEFVIDGKPDIWDIVATFAGAVFVHICAITGWAMHYRNGTGLITTTVGWIVFGVIMAALVVAYVLWLRKFCKKKS